MRRYSPNCWPESSGNRGRDRLESLAGMEWNHWPGSSGIFKIDRIIPAMPVHLAAEWVKGRLVAENRTVHQFPVPKEILPFLPNPYRINTSTYAISYATFHCPPDCNEPVEFCTVTGQSRLTPLYELVNRISLDDVVVLSLQSRQFAPGAGGFYPGDLWRLLDIVQKHLPADFLLCTGCKCHGIITGLSVMK